MSNTSNTTLNHLEPSGIWQQFQTLCDTPRPSFQEHLIREKLQRWASDRGLPTYIDTCGNLLIKKPATNDMQNRSTIVLQGHLDMVAQKEPDSTHDFTKDPLQLEIADGWISAKGTTLGADNGIGVAAALAVLASDDISHGPIEALFTIEEETSLRGATELETGILEGKILLNLDSEDRGDVYIGCAGGVDINGEKQYNPVPVEPESLSYQLKISGLRGGHSGLDIHKGVASANALLARILYTLNTQCTFSLTGIEGGTLRNAIAREAQATISVSEPHKDKIDQQLKLIALDIESEFKEIEDNLKIELSSTATVSNALTVNDQTELINLLVSLPHGVESMSRELAGVTHTSINLGVITLQQGSLNICLLARSLQDTNTRAIADKAAACFALAGAQTTFESEYPGWLPDPSTGLLKKFLDTHQQEMGFAANVKVIHAGLECGIIGAKYPGMEMVSFGPNIRGAHSPQERLEISSVADFWRLLVTLLKNL